MLKFAFWALLAANVAWFAASQGYLGHLSADEHEPQRLSKQIGTDKLVILSAQQAQDAVAAATVVDPVVLIIFIYADVIVIQRWHGHSIVVFVILRLVEINPNVAVVVFRCRLVKIEQNKQIGHVCS